MATRCRSLPSPFRKAISPYLMAVLVLLGLVALVFAGAVYQVVRLGVLAWRGLKVIREGLKSDRPWDYRKVIPEGHRRRV